MHSLSDAIKRAFEREPAWHLRTYTSQRRAPASMIRRMAGVCDLMPAYIRRAMTYRGTRTLVVTNRRGGVVAWIVYGTSRKSTFNPYGFVPGRVGVTCRVPAHSGAIMPVERNTQAWATIYGVCRDAKRARRLPRNLGRIVTRLLMAYAMDDLARRTTRRFLALEVAHGLRNEGAIRAYEALGFERVVPVGDRHRTPVGRDQCRFYNEPENHVFTMIRRRRLGRSFISRPKLRAALAHAPNAIKL